MANATFFASTDRVAIDCGLNHLTSTADFDAGSMVKEHVQCKNVVQEMHMQILRSARPYWNERYYNIALVANQTNYDFNSTAQVFSSVSNAYVVLPTSPDQIVEKSFTVLDAQANKKSMPENIDFRYYRRVLYSPTISNGPPEYWLFLPPDADEKLVLSVYPIPDQAYSMRFQAYKTPKDLTTSSDTIEFPPSHQNILWQYSRQYMELVLAEGQEPTIAAWLAPLMSELRIAVKGPTENRSAVDIGFTIGRYGRSKGRYNDGCDEFHAFSPG